MNSKHTAKVEKLRVQIEDYYTRNIPFRVYHGSSNSTRTKTYKQNEMVDVSNLDRVLSIDTDRKVVVAEPNVSMDTLLKATLKYGLMPPVVPEFPGITVGGAIQGGAIESGSFRYGAFSQTVTSMEMILGDGKVVRASPNEHADLFYATAGSYGSLGLITAAEIQLIPAKKYVQIKAIPIQEVQEGVYLTKKYTQTTCEFVECVIFAKNSGCVTVGTLSDTIEGTLQHFDRPHDTYYYLYIKEIIKSKKEIVFTITLKDYLFRFDRGAFWAAEAAFLNLGIPFNRFSRFLLDSRLHTKTLYKVVQQTAAAEQFICQDIVLPGENVSEFIKYTYETFGEFPTGWVAVKTEPKSKLQFNAMPNTDIVFNVGLYGPRIRDYEKFVKANRQIEDTVKKLRGRKWFYAHSYYTEQEFWDIYDKEWYEQVREKYNAIRLPNIYDRIQTKKQHIKNPKKIALKVMFGIGESMVKK